MNIKTKNLCITLILDDIENSWNRINKLKNELDFILDLENNSELNYSNEKSTIVHSIAYFRKLLHSSYLSLCDLSYYKSELDDKQKQLLVPIEKYLCHYYANLASDILDFNIHYKN